MLTLAIILNSSPIAWGPEPTPADAILILPGLLLGDELGNRPGRERWIDLHDERRADNARNRCDVADEIEVKLFID
jgi:hypothetical protein